jgi:hypothetical protein
MKTLAMILALAVVSPVGFVACDREPVASKETIKTDGHGNSSREKEVIKETPRGTEVTKEKEKTTTVTPP